MLTTITTKQIGSWTCQISNTVIPIPTKAKNQAFDMIDAWCGAYSSEGTWINSAFKVPSMMIKLDCVIRNDTLHLYGIDEQPDGIGLANSINPDFARRLVRLTNKWPRLKLVESGNRCPSDDHCWLGKPMTLKEYLYYLEQPEPECKGVVLVRSNPEETDFHQLLHKAAFPFIDEGQKFYGEKMGLWQKIQANQLEQLPWANGFVLKPLRGNRCQNLEIFHHQSKKQGIGGLASKTRIHETLARQKTMYFQPLIPPLESVSNPGFYYIYRIYFGFNPNHQHYEPLGGFWVGRHQNFKIHGTNDAIFGPLVMKSNK